MPPLMVMPGSGEPVSGTISRWLAAAQYESVSPLPPLEVVVMLVPERVYVPVSVFDSRVRMAVQVHPPPAAGEH
jgi:hypothetical protein